MLRLYNKFWESRDRGDVRVIYYARSRQGEIWVLTLYAKNVSDNIPAYILKKIKEEIDAWAQFRETQAPFSIFSCGHFGRTNGRVEDQKSRRFQYDC